MFLLDLVQAQNVVAELRFGAALFGHRCKYPVLTHTHTHTRHPSPADVYLMHLQCWLTNMILSILSMCVCVCVTIPQNIGNICSYVMCLVWFRWHRVKLTYQLNQGHDGFIFVFLPSPVPHSGVNIIPSSRTWKRRAHLNPKACERVCVFVKLRHVNAVCAFKLCEWWPHEDI